MNKNLYENFDLNYWCIVGQPKNSLANFLAKFFGIHSMGLIGANNLKQIHNSIGIVDKMPLLMTIFLCAECKFMCNSNKQISTLSDKYSYILMYFSYVLITMSNYCYLFNNIK